jgi:hypothetical protein
MAAPAGGCRHPTPVQSLARTGGCSLCRRSRPARRPRLLLVTARPAHPTTGPAATGEPDRDQGFSPALEGAVPPHGPLSPARRFDPRRDASATRASTADHTLTGTGISPRTRRLAPGLAYLGAHVGWARASPNWGPTSDGPALACPSPSRPGSGWTLSAWPRGARLGLAAA